VTTAEPAGANCANGGTKFQVGASTPAYVCNGASGSNGTSCSIVTNISTILSCSDGTSFVLSQKYSVGGTVSGFVGFFSLLDNGADSGPISANGAYSFATGLSTGATYAVTVGSQPVNGTGSVSSGTGTIASTNVTSANVACSCNASYANCDGSPATGCETATTADNNNCGACGNVCGAATHCSASACVSNYPSYKIGDGPGYGSNPPTYTCQEACALLFGGGYSSYRCSTRSDTITYTAWTQGRGEGAPEGPGSRISSGCAAPVVTRARNDESAAGMASTPAALTSPPACMAKTATSWPSRRTSSARNPSARRRPKRTQMSRASRTVAAAAAACPTTPASSSRKWRPARAANAGSPEATMASRSSATWRRSGIQPSGSRSWARVNPWRTRMGAASIPRASSSRRMSRVTQLLIPGSRKTLRSADRLALLGMADVMAPPVRQHLTNVSPSTSAAMESSRRWSP
jgi:hypothetical protein